MDEREYDFFISYSNADIEKASPIVEVMEKDYGAKCWFQEKDSKAEFVDAIMEGIENSKAFIVFISAHSANSYFVLNEVNHAIEWRGEHEEYKIVPVIIDGEHPEISDSVYKKIRFYLGRLNVICGTRMESEDSLVTKIFDQADFEPASKALHRSLYHSSESEEKRLRAQNEILRDFSREFFEKTVKPDFYILDVGCAAGDNISLRLEGLPYAGLLGVDIDEAQIEKARANYGGERNSFIACDITSDKFDDVLEDYLDDKDIAGFDLIHISAVLLHLSNPVSLLRVLRRYLKKSGSIFIQDEDDGANLVYPYSKFFDRAFAIWADSEESGDRCCGRKIPSYLSAAVYKHVSLVKCGVSDAGLTQEKRTALWDIYFNYHLWLAAQENMFRNAVKTGKMLEEYEKEYDHYKKEYDEGKIFIQLGFLFFIAQK